MNTLFASCAALDDYLDIGRELEGQGKRWLVLLVIRAIGSALIIIIGALVLCGFCSLVGIRSVLIINVVAIVIIVGV